MQGSFAPCPAQLLINRADPCTMKRPSPHSSTAPQALHSHHLLSDSPSCMHMCAGLGHESRAVQWGTLRWWICIQTYGCSSVRWSHHLASPDIDSRKASSHTCTHARTHTHAHILIQNVDDAFNYGKVVVLPLDIACNQILLWQHDA